MEEKINLQHVVESLAEQKKAADVAGAYKDAFLRAREERIAELEEEIEKLREQLIGEMDEASEE